MGFADAVAVLDVAIQGSEAMTPVLITDWIHQHMATVTVRADSQHYTGLMVTVEAAGKTAEFGPSWDFDESVAAAIQAWEKLP